MTAAVAPFRDTGPPDEPAVKVPPRNLDAEQALLGAILMNNRAYERVADFLKPEHFSDPANGKIYDAAAKMIEAGHAVDVVTLKGMFERDGELSQIGGVGYLARLAGSAITIINADDYGRTILDAHLRRQLIDLGDAITTQAYAHSLDMDAAKQIEQAEHGIYTLATTGHSRRKGLTLAEAADRAMVQAEQAYKTQGRLVGITTGLTELNARLGGLHPTDLAILAARPAMGKTALAVGIAYAAAKEALENGLDGSGAAVGFFSLEMSAPQLSVRVMSYLASVASDRIQKGDLSAEEWSRLCQAQQQLRDVPLFIDDTSGLTIGAIRSKARQWQRQKKVGLIVIDYLQYIAGAGRSSKAENRVQEVTEITMGLKAMAKELEVPVLALSQLSRAVEARENKRPMMSDLRESGSIEQDADVCMFLFREEYYLAQQKPTRKVNEGDQALNDRTEAWEEACEKAKGRAEVIIGKNRKGPTTTVHLHFDGPTTRFSDPYRGEEP